ITDVPFLLLPTVAETMTRPGLETFLEGVMGRIKDPGYTFAFQGMLRAEQCSGTTGDAIRKGLAGIPPRSLHLYLTNAEQKGGGKEPLFVVVRVTGARPRVVGLGLGGRDQLKGK